MAQKVKPEELKFLDDETPQAGETVKLEDLKFLDEPATPTAAPAPVPAPAADDSGRPAASTSPIAGFVRGFASGGSFNLGPSAMAAIDPEMTAEDYERLYKEQADLTPTPFGAGRVIGSALSVGKLLKLLGVIGEGAAQLLTAIRALRGAAAGGAVAGTEAGTRAEASLTQDPLAFAKEVLPQAGLGTVVGGAGGAAPLTTASILGPYLIQKGLTDESLTPAERTEAVLGGGLSLGGAAAGYLGPKVKDLGARTGFRSLGGGPRARAALEGGATPEELGTLLMEEKVLPVTGGRRGVEEALGKKATDVGQAKTAAEQNLDVIAQQTGARLPTRGGAAARVLRELFRPRQEFQSEYGRLQKELLRLQGGPKSRKPLTLQELTRLKNEYRDLLGKGAWEGEQGLTQEQLKSMQSFLVKLQNETAESIAQSAKQPKLAKDYMELKEKYGLLQDLKDIATDVRTRGESRGLGSEPLKSLLESEPAAATGRALAKGTYNVGKGMEALGRGGVGAAVSGGGQMSPEQQEALVRFLLGEEE